MSSLTHSRSRAIERFSQACRDNLLLEQLQQAEFRYNAGTDTWQALIDGVVMVEAPAKLGPDSPTTTRPC